MRLLLAERRSRVREATAAGSPDERVNRLSDGNDPLTPREHDVLAAMLDGACNKAISMGLGVSHRPMVNHPARVLAKLNASSATKLMRRAILTWRDDRLP